MFVLKHIKIIALFAAALFITLFPQNAAAAHGNPECTRPKIIIDAGHGGFDGGAEAADGTNEKDLNLAIALKVGDFARAFGYETVMTRSEDRALCDGISATRKNKVEDMKNRLSVIEKNSDAIFVSIHINKFEASSVNGAQVFFSPNNENSMALSENIQSSISSHLQPDNKRVIKKSGDGIFLLKKAQIPSVLVECGFLSNTRELSLLKDNIYQSKLAFSIVLGINSYYNTKEKNG